MGPFEVQGHKMFLDEEDHMGLSHQEIWEPGTTDLIKREVKRGYIILNIGANIGYYTLILSGLVGGEGKVFAFEPEPTNFELLKKNAEINNCRNVALVRKAVSNKTGTARLHSCGAGQGRFSIRSNGHHDIETIRLDDYFKNYEGKIHFIKMDVEGAEEAIVQGMPLLLKRNKEIKIITEFAPVRLKEFGSDSESYLKLLLGYSFKLYMISWDKGGKIKGVSIAELLKNYTPENLHYINLFCSREDQIQCPESR